MGLYGNPNGLVPFLGYRTIVLGYCLRFGIAHTIDLEGGLLIGIVRPDELRYCH